MTPPSEDLKIASGRPWLLSPPSRSVVAVFCLLTVAAIAAPYAYAAALHLGHITLRMLRDGGLGMLLHALPIAPYFLLILFLRQDHRLRVRLAWPLALLAICAPLAIYFSYFFDLLSHHPSLSRFPQVFHGSTLVILLVPPTSALVGQALVGAALRRVQGWADRWFLSPAQRRAVLLCYLATLAAITLPLLLVLNRPAKWSFGFPSIEWLALGLLHAPFFVFVSLLPRGASIRARLSWPIGALSIAFAAGLFGFEILMVTPFPFWVAGPPATIYGVPTQLFGLGPPVSVLVAQAVVLCAQVRLAADAPQSAQQELRRRSGAYIPSLVGLRRWGLYALYAGAMLVLHRRILEWMPHF